MPYRDMRAPYESIVLPLLFLREENMTPPNDTLEFMASLLEETQYTGNATLRLSFKGVTNYTVKELDYIINGWEVSGEWKGNGKEANIQLNPRLLRQKKQVCCNLRRASSSKRVGLF
ncbi:hypothetical protein [Thermococcus peptonophilus]|uniref:Uncharacterized protein n=1 Tax=Thermococcus peptonophilus TaxID=53952 RepID=A0A142CVF1_9EURY|nr:hypothetical protein [Thermococcus peptonophilus]AMQ18753.1 hypothetical protein A0127_05995 [Thermococcus peptonophilus]